MQFLYHFLLSHDNGCEASAVPTILIAILNSSGKTTCRFLHACMFRFKNVVSILNFLNLLESNDLLCLFCDQ